MLIEFSVSNFRSFRERQTLSMVAAARLKKRENVLSPMLDGEKFPDLLKVAAVYGPNASGKSNLLKAMDVIATLTSATPAPAAIPVAPFRFDPALAAEPSRFEINFIHRGLRYQFELAVTPARIVGERLTAYPKGKDCLLYERSHVDGAGDTYAMGATLEGGASLHRIWQRLTGPASLFLAQAAMHSSEACVQLRHPHEWLSRGMVVLDRGMAGPARAAQRELVRTPALGDQLAAFLREVDVPVSTIRTGEPVTSPAESLRMQARSPAWTAFTHRSAIGAADFDFGEQSQGTKNLMGFWFYWNAMATGAGGFDVVAVDELDRSLHPEIVAALIKKCLARNEIGQLIFTTHDTHLMGQGQLRRDQLWITERDMHGATQLRSVHEFEGRESEDVQKRYFEGRYRGLPLLRAG